MDIEWIDSLPLFYVSLIIILFIGSVTNPSFAESVVDAFQLPFKPFTFFDEYFERKRLIWLKSRSYVKMKYIKEKKERK
ncbi:MAG: hypothetical protein HOP08_13895 [Cyclobacteriaceae bacterium]|nr:hypothetical protein [Cyclobacteriaceae bacterium]